MSLYHILLTIIPYLKSNFWWQFSVRSWHIKYLCYLNSPSGLVLLIHQITFNVQSSIPFYGTWPQLLQNAKLNLMSTYGHMRSFLEQRKENAGQEYRWVWIITWNQLEVNSCCITSPVRVAMKYGNKRVFSWLEEFHIGVWLFIWQLGRDDLRYESILFQRQFLTCWSRTYIEEYLKMNVIAQRVDCQIRFTQIINITQYQHLNIVQRIISRHREGQKFFMDSTSLV